MLLGVEKDLVWTWHRLPGNQIAESGVAALLDGRIEADVVAAVTHQIKDALRLKIHFGCDLLDLRIAAEPPLEGPAYGTHLIDLLSDMNGEPDNSALLGDATANGLPHPPRAVRRELEPLGVVELLYCADKTGVAFLHQIQKGHLRPAILARNRNHQTKVGRHEMLHGPTAFINQELQFSLGRSLGVLSALSECHLAREDVLRIKTNLDRLRELDLLFGGQQRSLGDAFQI